MPIDMFESRTMLAALEESFKPRTFLTDMFFPQEETHGEKWIDITIEKGKRKLAPFVSPRAEGRTLKRDGRTVKSYAIPLLKPKRVTNAEDLVKRNNGSSIYTPENLMQKSAEELGKDLVELTNSIVRRVEWMAAQALTTGKITVSGVVDDGDDSAVVDDEVDFNMDSTHKITLTGAALWTASTGNPIKDLRDWKRLIAKDSGLSARVVVFGSSVAEAFVNNDNVKGSLSNRRIEQGQINPQELPEGVTYWGYLNDPGLDIYSYDEWYLDDNGVEQPMIPVDHLVMGSTNARATQHYGPILDMDAIEQGMAINKYFPKSWRKKDPSARFVMVQSAPLTIPHQIDAFVTAKVV